MRNIVCELSSNLNKLMQEIREAIKEQDNTKLSNLKKKIEELSIDDKLIRMI